MAKSWAFIDTFESCGTKIMLRGPIVCQLCVGRNRETKILDDEFHGLFQTAKHFLCCQSTTLAKYSRHAWSLFGANIG